MTEPSIPEPASLEDISRQRTLWARGVPMVLTVVIFFLIFWRIPFGAFWQALSKAQLLPFLALMGSFSLCFFLLDTFVLSRLIRWFHGPLPYRELLPVRAVTYLVSIINTQLAQGALALYMHRRFRTPLAQITSTVALMILLETTNLILFATIGCLAFPGGAPLALLALPLILVLVWLLIMGLARGKLGVLGQTPERQRTPLDLQACPPAPLRRHPGSQRGRVLPGAARAQSGPGLFWHPHSPHAPCGLSPHRLPGGSAPHHGSPSRHLAGSLDLFLQRLCA